MLMLKEWAEQIGLDPDGLAVLRAQANGDATITVQLFAMRPEEPSSDCKIAAGEKYTDSQGLPQIAPTGETAKVSERGCECGAAKIGGQCYSWCPKFSAAERY